MLHVRRWRSCLSLPELICKTPMSSDVLASDCDADSVIQMTLDVHPLVFLRGTFRI